MKLNSLFKSFPFTLFLSILSGQLIYWGWPTNGNYPLLFFGFVPLYIALENVLKYNGIKKIASIVIILFASHLSWLFGTASWLSDSTTQTYILLIVVESLIFSVPFVFLSNFSNSKKFIFWLLFISTWITLEYVTQNWLLSIPYFILGSGLGMSAYLIQTYEYIGIEGGSIFILITNISLFLILKKAFQKESILINVLMLFLGLFPFLFSAFFMHIPKLTEEKTSSLDSIHVALLHSYLPTYQKEQHLHPELTIEKLWNISHQNQNSNAELLVWPETIVSNLGWLSNQQNESSYLAFMKIFSQNNIIPICTGGHGFSLYNNGKDNPYAAYDSNRNFYYLTHNLAITYHPNGQQEIRSKEIFVPFQERIPYLKSFPFLKHFADVVGSNAKISVYEKGREIHKTSKNHRFIPILCYESIFPLQMARYAKKVDFITILANENWNPNVDGSHQYLYNNVGVAIQSRIPIFRSSNHGVSSVVDKYGKILIKRVDKDQGIIDAYAVQKTETTIYEMYSGSSYLISILLYFGIILYVLYKKLSIKKLPKK